LSGGITSRIAPEQTAGNMIGKSTAPIATGTDDAKARIAVNIGSVRQRIVDAARRSGRDPDEISLIVVTKTVGVPEILHAADCGVEAVGENRVHEAIEKHGRVGDRVQWHMIGHLQRRKVKDAVQVFDYIHSVDSMALAGEIDKRCATADKVMPVLFEVNVSGEESKFGLNPEETVETIREAAMLERIRIEGLMTMAPYVEDPEKVRPCFKQLADLSHTVAAASMPNVNMKHLSMGMTNDFEVAVEEGATMVRVGTAIFGGI
jgi:pyridoxal phosphate enzyme (YggS family)